jgi:hypothetical protein
MLKIHVFALMQGREMASCRYLGSQPFRTRLGTPLPCTVTCLPTVSIRVPILPRSVSADDARFKRLSLRAFPENWSLKSWVASSPTQNALGTHLRAFFCRGSSLWPVGAFSSRRHACAVVVINRSPPYLLFSFFIAFIQDILSDSIFSPYVLLARLIRGKRIPSLPSSIIVPDDSRFTLPYRFIISRDSIRPDARHITTNKHNAVHHSLRRHVRCCYYISSSNCA